jgi:PAS domain S-box-containing protein
MVAHSHPPLGDVSCRATGYTIQQLQQMGLPTAHLTRGLAYTLDELQSHSASIPWDDYLVFLHNSHTDLPTDQLVELCSSYKGSAHFRLFLSAAGLWFHPARYFRWVADPKSGAIQQLFRCVNTRFTQVGERDVVFEEVIEPGFTLPPDIFWETQSIAFGALTTHFGLGPSIVTWEPIERGVVFRVRLPRRRPVRFVLSWLASWFRRDTAEDIRSALSYGHERSLRLEKEIAERKTAEAARRESEGRFRRITNAVPGALYQYFLDPDGRQGFVFVSGGATDLTGYAPDELIARPELIWERIDPEYIPGVQHSILESARNGTPWQHEFRFRTKAGESRWVRGRSIPEPVSGSGKVVWNGILTDVTAEKQADAQLRARDALLQKLSEQVPGFIYQYQQWPDGRSCFPYASEGIRDIYEVTSDEVRGSAATVYVRLHPDDLDAVAESIRQSLETLEPWGCEYRVVLPTRGTRWLDGHAAPERMPDGSTIWYGYIRDVTDRKLAEDSIRESETRFRTLIEDLEVGVVLQDETDRVLVSNDAAATTLGMTPDQLHGVTSMDLRWELVREDGTPLPPEQVPSVAAARTLRPVRNAVLGTFHRETGHRTWLQVNATPRLNADGSLRHVLVSLVDITLRKRAEEALQASDTRFRAFMEFSPILAWIVSPDGRILFANHGFARRLNKSPAEVERSTIHDIFPPDYAAEYLDNNRRVLEGGLPLETIEHATRADGSDGEFLAYKFPLPDGSGLVGGVAVDVTDRRRAEAALRESEEQLRLSLHAAGQGLFDLDLGTGNAKVSPEYATMIGYDPATFRETNSSWADRLHPDDRERVYGTFEAYVRGEIPQYEVEFRQRTRAGDWLWTLSMGGIVSRDNSGKPLRMLGTHTNISTRKRADADLRVASARAEQFYRLCEVAGQGIGIARLDGTLTYMNPAFRRMLELPDGDDVTRRAFWELVPSETHQFLSETVLTQTRENGFWSGEFDLMTLTGKRVPIINTVVLLRDPDGTVVGYSNIATDITEQKRAEAALRESELRYRTLIETSSDAIFLMNLTGHIRSANPAAVRIHGYSMEELLAMRMQELDLPDDASVVPDRMRRLRAGESLTFEVVHRRKDGTTFPVEVIASAVEIGGEWLVLAFDRDITERKRGESVLRFQHALLRAQTEASPDGILVVDPANHILSYNHRFLDVWGIPDELPAAGDDTKVLARARTLAADPVAFGARVAAIYADPDTPSHDEVALADGRTLDRYSRPIRGADGELLGLVWYFRDITDRKQAETELRQSEERLRLALSAATAVAFVWDAATDSVVRYFSTEPALPVNPHAPEPVAAVRAKVHPDDRERFDAGIAACLADGSDYRNLYRVARPDGTVRWLEEWGTLDRDRTGLPVRLTGISIDVTERKEAEAALQLAERRQRLALDAGRMGTWDWEIGSDGLSWDAREQILFGFGPGEFDRRIDTFLSRVHPDDRPAVGQVLADAAAGKDFDGEFRIRFPSGEIRWIHGSGVVVPKSDHTPPRLVGINYDITERKTAEAALRESEERLRIFVESAPAGVAMLDRDVRYLSYSRRWLTDYGLGDQNLVGRSHYEVFPEVTDRWKEIHRRCLTGVSERCEQDRFDRADGTVDYLRWEIQPWTDATGAVGGLVFFTEMITDRVRAEDQVRASLREKEAMLKEIHHRVKNNLQVISSLLSLQAARVTHPAATDVLAESQNRIRAMALVHETLYRSDDLARVDLSQYLGELCGYLFRSYGVDSARVRLELDVEPVTVSLDKTIPCGLLVNEIVSNSLKYAFPNTRSGTVTVGAHTRPDSHLTLTLADDGVGLPAEIVVDRTASLGLQLVNILTEQLGGQLTVERSPGTRFVISFAP